MNDLGTVSVDAAGRIRSSQITTLGDYKVIGFDQTLSMETVGTGSGAFSNNAYVLSATNGKYMIRQSRRFHAYFSGKSQIIECTFDTFQREAGVTKRVGYFSSSAVAPYNANYDGFWLENDGQTITLKAARNGTETISVPWNQWDNYSEIHGYDWSLFTIVLFDFLWLGGSQLRLWLFSPVHKKFILLHTAPFAGMQKNTLCLSPYQPLRYEIRGVSGDGTFKAICAQVATEGSIGESGLTRSIDIGATALALTGGTQYPLLAFRKQTAYRDIPSRIVDLNVLVTTANDLVRWSLQINPTLSAGLTYGNLANSSLQSAAGDGVITVATPGTIIASGYLPQAIPIAYNALIDNYLSWLSSSIANSMDQYVLCATPVANLSVLASMTAKEY